MSGALPLITYHSSRPFRRRRLSRRLSRPLLALVGDVGRDGRRDGGAILVLLLRAAELLRGGGVVDLRLAVVGCVAHRALVVGERLAPRARGAARVAPADVGARQLFARLGVGEVALGLMFEPLYLGVERGRPAAALRRRARLRRGLFASGA